MAHATKKPKHTFAEINALLAYDPGTGVLAWKSIRPGIRLRGEAGGVNGKGHRQIMIDGLYYYAHRVAWLLSYGDWPVEDIDHIDGDPANNRLINLREATCSQNMGNAKRSVRNTSGFKGVTWNKRLKKWQVKIMINRCNHHLGYFTDVELAHAAYCDAAHKRFGAFANFGVNTRT
jgi:HNH endonuclease/AP2 domain